MSGTFTIVYRQPDMLAANWLMLRNKWVWKGTTQFFGTIAGLLLALLLATSWDRVVSEPLAVLPTMVMIALCGGLGGLLLMLPYWFFILPRIVRKHFTDMALEGKQASFEYGPEQLRLVDANNDTRVAWSEFRQWSENDKVMLLYRSDFCCHYVPTAQVDATHVTALRALLGQAGTKRA